MRSDWHERPAGNLSVAGNIVCIYEVSTLKLRLGLVRPRPTSRPTPGGLGVPRSVRSIAAVFFLFANAASLVVDIPETEATLPLGAVIAQEVAPRMHSDDQVIYRLEGGTVQDLFVATWGFNWAKARGLGKDFNLSAE